MVVNAAVGIMWAEKVGITIRFVKFIGTVLHSPSESLFHLQALLIL